MPEKINYCDASGECNAPHFNNEKDCEHFIPSTICGGCLMCTWFGRCMSPVATDAAKKTTSLEG